jgi:hypothetical protein
VLSVEDSLLLMEAFQPLAEMVVTVHFLLQDLLVLDPLVEDPEEGRRGREEGKGRKKE